MPRTRALLTCLVNLIWLMPALLGQGEARFWYYDRGVALDFAGGSPISLNNSAMGDGQAAAAISNPCGDLLFYVGSDTAWNASHVPLQNGTGLTYGVIHRLIVPNPGNSNQYYVFSGGGSGSVSYSVVDVSAAGGTGAVLQKNVVFHTSNTFFDQRKIAGVIHANETDYWIAVVDFPSDDIYAYRLTATGLSPNPVISTVGPITNGQNNNSYSAQTKFSSDGSKFVTGASLDTKVFVMEFDNNAGTFSNMITIQSPSSTFGAGVTGIEFSQDGSKLYWTYYLAFPFTPGIHQVDLSVWNAAAITASMTTIPAPLGFNSHGGMQLANNGKIYLARAGANINVPPPQNWHYLDAINFPNNPGLASNYQSQALVVFPNRNSIYTPTIAANFLRPWEIELSGSNGPLGPIICEGDSLHIGLSYYSYFNQTDSIRWDLGDGTGSYNALQLTYAYDTTGLFPISALVYRGCLIPDTLRDTVQILPVPEVNLGSDTTLCEGLTHLLETGTKPGIAYLWSNGSTGTTFLADTTGWIWVAASSVCATIRDSLYLDYDSLFTLNLGPADTLLCPGQGLLLDATIPQGRYRWQDGSMAAQFSIPAAWPGGGPRLFEVSASNVCDTLRDSILVQYEQTPTVSLGPDTLLCDAASLTLDATFTGVGTTQYRWQDGSTAPQFQVVGSQVPSQGGNYWVAVSNQCGTVRDSIQLNLQLIPSVELGPTDTLLCDESEWELTASFPNATYQWQDGSTDANFLVTASGLYAVRVTNLCGSASDEIQVQFAQPPQVELGPDTALCEGEILFLDASFPTAEYLWQDGSTDAYFQIDGNQPGRYSVVLTTLCGTVEDQREVDFYPPPRVELGPDTFLCGKVPLLFDLSHLRADFLWQDGSSQAYYQSETAETIRVLATNACSSDRDTVIIQRENCSCSVFIPSAFTPNDDGYNDLFSLGHSCNFQSFELQIFNRWGQRVFVSQDPSQSWDGTTRGIPQAEGVFSYLLTYRYLARGGYTGKREAGYVTLWR